MGATATKNMTAHAQASFVLGPLVLPESFLCLGPYPAETQVRLVLEGTVARSISYAS